MQIDAEVKGFEPSQRLDPKLVRRTDRFVQLGLWAADEAVRDSKIDFEKEDRNRIGVITGCGMGGIQSWEAQYAQFLAKGPRRVSPLLVPMMIPDMACGQIAIAYGLRGVFTPLLVAAGFAYILNPVVSWFEKRRRVNRLTTVIVRPLRMAA